jgi:uncharacterized membrane protein
LSAAQGTAIGHQSAKAFALRAKPLNTKKGEHMISSATAFDMGSKALKGFRLNTAGITLLGYIALIVFTVVIYFFYALLFPSDEPSTPQAIANFILSIVQNIIIYLFSVGCYAYLYDILKHRQTSFAKLFVGFKNFSRNATIIFIGTFIMSAISSIIVEIYEFLFKYKPIENNIGSYIILSCVICIVLCCLAYKLLPTWMGLIYKMSTDNTTGAMELIKQTYRQVSVYNYNYLCFTCRAMLWCLVGVLTMGIGLLWIIPLIGMSTIIFFDAIFNPEDYAAPEFPDAPAQETPSAEPV